jgi:hypothetical protein
MLLTLVLLLGRQHTVNLTTLRLIAISLVTLRMRLAVQLLQAIPYDTQFHERIVLTLLWFCA